MPAQGEKGTFSKQKNTVEKKLSAVKTSWLSESSHEYYKSWILVSTDIDSPRLIHADLYHRQIAPFCINIITVSANNNRLMKISPEAREGKPCHKLYLNGLGRFSLEHISW